MAQYKIDDIAKKANVSPSTVSRVINGRPGVSMKKRQMVNEVISAMNYEPNWVAQSLAKGSTNIVALIIDDIRNPYYSTVAFNIQEELSKHDYKLIILSHENDIQKNLNFFQLSRQFNFAGIILTTALENEMLKDELKKINCPVVLFNRIIDNFDGDYVTQDNYLAGYKITKHMIETGHSEIAMITGPITSSTSFQRYKGYCHAIKMFGLETRDEWILSGDLKLKTGYEIGLDYIDKLSVMPKAVILGNDMMAIGFIDACYKMGVRIPDDISVAGFDNIQIAGLNMISLTTVQEPTLDMARIATECLIEKINNPQSPVRRVVLEPELIIRSSTLNNQK